jgi:threonine dehydrogenase-like Zn-dependent dehydrogenase
MAGAFMLRCGRCRSCLLSASITCGMRRYGEVVGGVPRDGMPAKCTVVDPWRGGAPPGATRTGACTLIMKGVYGGAPSGALAAGTWQCASRHGRDMQRW